MHMHMQAHFRLRQLIRDGGYHRSLYPICYLYLAIPKQNILHDRAARKRLNANPTVRLDAQRLPGNLTATGDGGTSEVSTSDAGLSWRA